VGDGEKFAILSEIHTPTQAGENRTTPPPPFWPTKRVYETIKLFSFPFLTLKRNGKYTEGGMNVGWGGVGGLGGLGGVVWVLFGESEK